MDRVEELLGELRALKAMIERKDLPVLLSREAAALEMSVSVDTLDKMIKTGVIAVRRVGRTVLVPRREIEEFANGATRAPKRGRPPTKPRPQPEQMDAEALRKQLRERPTTKF